MRYVKWQLKVETDAEYWKINLRFLRDAETWYSSFFPWTLRRNVKYDREINKTSARIECSDRLKQRLNINKEVENCRT